MKKDGEEILIGTSLKMESLHKRVTGNDIEGLCKTCFVTTTETHRQYYNYC